jgi:hypothetical protein
MNDQSNNQQYSGGFSFGDQGANGAQQAQPQTGGQFQAAPAPAPIPSYPMPQAPAQAAAPAPAAFPAANPAAPMAGAGGAQPTGARPPAAGGAQQAPFDPNYKFGSKMKDFTTTVKLLPNNLNFDENYFLNLLAGSISLTKEEKKKILDSIPKLRQAQVDELIRIFEEERAKFIELSPKHGRQLDKLEKEHQADWVDIELMYKSEAKAQQDDAAADDIRKQLGL